MVGTDTEIHSQTLGGAYGIQQKKGRRIVGVRGVKGTSRKLTESTNLSSQRLTETELTITRSLHGIDLGL